MLRGKGLQIARDDHARPQIRACGTRRAKRWVSGGWGRLAPRPALLRLLATPRPHRRLKGPPAPVVPDAPRRGAVELAADVLGVDEEALVGALHLDYDFRDGNVGGRGDGGSEAAADLVDLDRDLGVDDAFEGEDGVGQGSASDLRRGTHHVAVPPAAAANREYRCASRANRTRNIRGT